MSGNRTEPNRTASPLCFKPCCNCPYVCKGRESSEKGEGWFCEAVILCEEPEVQCRDVLRPESHSRPQSAEQLLPQELANNSRELAVTCRRPAHKPVGIERRRSILAAVQGDNLHQQQTDAGFLSTLVTLLLSAAHFTGFSSANRLPPSRCVLSIVSSSSSNQRRFTASINLLPISYKSLSSPPTAPHKCLNSLLTAFLSGALPPHSRLPQAVSQLLLLHSFTCFCVILLYHKHQHRIKAEGNYPQLHFKQLAASA